MQAHMKGVGAVRDIRIDENAPILVDLTSHAGLQAVSFSPSDLAEKSTRAIDSAMTTIHNMAVRINATVESLIERPAKVEVEFGLKLDAEAGALIAKTGIEASLNVKLTWEKQNPSREQRSSATA